MTASLESRIEALEDLARAISDSREADARLTQGVERLADETGGLNSILTKVDEQQQRLSTLGRDLERVEKTKVGKEDLEAAKKEQAAITLDFRKRTLVRIYTTGLLLAALLLAAGGTFAWYQEEKRRAQFKICEDRNLQSQAVLDILKGSIADVPPEQANTPGVQNVREGIARFESLIIDCEAGL